ncbi:MAG: YraN family protein [Actinomycetales bacterium]|nr:YraN family protein [Actinomycetales bacterium]
MQLTRKQIGDIGEEMAEKFLRNLNYIILARNFRTKRGELDIIALDNRTLVFCEVKTRSTVRQGLPAEAISALKFQHIRQVALIWLRLNSVPHEAIRFDLISVLGPLAKNPKIEHLRGIEL